MTGSDLAGCDCLLLIRHTDDCQHKVDEVERTKEHDQDEEDDIPWTIGSDHLQRDKIIKINKCAHGSLARISCSAIKL